MTEEVRAVGHAEVSVVDPPIERVSANDLMQLAVEAGSVPMQVGAVLVLEGDLDLATVRAELAHRIEGIPRLRQRLHRGAPGSGRPVWVDDATFDLVEHVQGRPCPAPGDESALLAGASDLLGRPLPGDRPLWSATLVAGVAGGRSALVIVFHHVLADGIGGLAALGALVDGAPPAVGYGFPRPVPTWGHLAVDAQRRRLAGVRRWRAWLAGVRAALAELAPGRQARAPRSSLNRPTGRRRRSQVVRADLQGVRSVAHAHGATVNDVVLAAVTGALGGVLHERGEEVDRLVVSIPISGRAAATSDELGNQVGVLPVELPTGGRFDERLEAVAAVTRARKDHPGRGSSTALVDPLFRALGRLGLMRGFLDHQHLINTLVTNLRGPTEDLWFVGRRISDLLPLSIVTGNVTVAFAVLSYSGTLDVVVDADAEAWSDLDRLVARLDEQLQAAVAGTLPATRQLP